MAGLNIAEWTPEQVSEWLSGLGPTVAQYVPSLRARGLDGVKLLTLRCDDLEYLGVHVIGHQELLLEAVEHLRNFHYELSRECIQQLALRVSVVAASLARALRHHTDARLETQTLADVARTVHAVKPLVCWLDRWALGGGADCALGARRGELLQLSLEAATCAMRDRWSEQPARAVAAAAATTAAAAADIVRHAADPAVLAPAALHAASLRPRRAELGFDVRRSYCGHLQLANIRFGSPAHASGAVHAGDEVVQVGARCVLGWSARAVEAACAAAAARGELALRLRRRAPRAPPALTRRARRPPPEPAPDEAASDDSGPLSPPASPTLLPARVYPLKPRAQLLARRHSVGGGSPAARRPTHTIDQLWQRLRAARAEPDDAALYDRDKAVSCGAGLQLRAPPPPAAAERRGRLDKAHSTPAYDPGAAPVGALVEQVIPESPPAPRDSPAAAGALKADQILEFKKSSSQIAEAMQQRRAPDEAERPLETVNAALLERRRRSPPDPPPDPAPRAAPALSPAPAAADRRGAPRYSYLRGASRGRASPPPPPPRVALPVLRAVPRDEPPSPSRPARPLDATQISLPLRHVACGAREPPAINAAPPPPASRAPETPPEPRGIALSPASAVRGIFPSSKARSLKKQSSILAKRRGVPYGAAAARGAAGAAWQRVRAGAGARWERRALLLAHGALYAYRAPDSQRAALMMLLPGAAVAAAPEVRSRAHAFKVYHTGTAFYFACDEREDTLAWIQLIHRATLLPQVDGVERFSETDYSDAESDADGADRDREKDRDKSKFGSLKKLTGRGQRSESQENVAHSSTSLDRKYLRFFSRHRSKDDSKTKSKQPVPTEHYRSYRRVAPPGGAPGPAASADAPAGAEPRVAKRIPKPINYIHASNPNLLDFEKSDFVTKPALQPPAKPKPAAPESLAGLVTLEQFMLDKQQEERRQLYDNRVLLGVERGRHLRRRLDRIVPDVIYGEVGAESAPAGSALAAAPLAAPSVPKERRPEPGAGKPVSVKGKDGYEKIVYPDEAPEAADDDVASPPRPAPPAPPAPERWRDSLRRNDKVHSAGGAASPVRPAALDTWGGAQYPHLQCPPTFHPETYSLTARPRRPRRL